MAKKSPIPESNVDWPEYEYRAFPAWVGRDENGADLIAQSKDEVKDLEARKVYPKVLGLNKAGAEVVALDPTEEQLKQADVVSDAKKVTKPSKTDKE